MPNVVRVFAVIQGVKGNMRLGITTDDQLVVVAREVMQCTRGVHKTSDCHALAGGPKRKFNTFGPIYYSPGENRG